MALVVTRQKDGTYKTTLTGVDKAFDFTKKVAKAVVGAPKAYVDAVAKANKRKRDFDDAEEVRQIERAFGSVDNYKKLDPMFRTRTERRSGK